MFALSWQYLTGRSVAAQPSDREAAEWPPHPDRVFQALVAAWGERGCAADERAALTWLEALPPPDVVAAPAPTEGDAAVLAAAAPKVYVPVNDTEGPARGKYADGHLALLPSRRPRKERYFPAVNVGATVTTLVWPDANADTHRDALVSLAAAVTYLGHSSSLVRMWIDDVPAPASLRPARAGDDVTLRLRVPERGRLAALERAYAGGVAGWARPSTATPCAYVHSALADAATGTMSGRILVLRRVAGVRADVSRTQALTARLRSVLLPFAKDRALAVLAGHEADGSRLDEAHVAYVPLAFAGSAHADGHVLGLGLVLPRDLDADTEMQIQYAVADALSGDTGALELVLGDGRACTFVPEDRAIPPAALTPGTWIGPSRTWATVTPVVLDRMPPRRTADPEAFMRNVLADAAVHAGLPRPMSVVVGDVSWLVGVPHVRSFDPLPTKTGQGRKQVHAVFRFPVAVRGPVLLGAGRHRGYGFCKPLADQESP